MPVNNQPWSGDACSLVEAFRAGTLSPSEALEGSLSAIDASDLNAFSHVDVEAARSAAVSADISLPFGGVPMGVKELESVDGWPYSEASLVFKDRMADHDSTQVARLRAAGAVLCGPDHRLGVRWASTAPTPGCTAPPATRGTLSAPPAGRRAARPPPLAGGLLPIASGGDGGGLDPHPRRLHRASSA